MIERDIKDTDKYEAKFIGPLSTRQTICGVIGAAFAITGYFLTRNALGDVAFFIGVLAGFPWFLCGFYKPHNIPFEKFAKSVFISMFLAPAKRRYKTENTYDSLLYDKPVTQKQSSYKSQDKSNQEV